MKNIIITSALLLLLTACGGKVSNIVSFTKPVAADGVGGTVVIPAQTHLSSWNSDNVGSNITINSSKNKFNKLKLPVQQNISVDPVITDGKIFLLTKDGYLTALAEDSLKKLWSIDLVNKSSKSSYLWGGITYHNGKLFVANGSRSFNIIDANNGNLLFSKQFPDLIVTKPVFAGNLIILQTMSNQVYMLDLGNNAIVWDHVGNPEVLQGGIAIDPVITPDGKAILSYTSGQIALIDLKQRAEIWQMDLASDNEMPEYVAVNLAVTPIVEDKDGYFADNNGKIFKINLETGALLWKKEIDDVRTVNNTINALVMTTNGRQVIALDKSSGKVLWSTDLGEKGKTRNKWAPVNYVSSLIMNDMLNIYTSTGEHYVIELANGRVISKDNVGTKLGFVTVTNKIRLFNGNYIYISEPIQESKIAKFFDRFKKAPAEEKIKDTTTTAPAPVPAKKKSWFNIFKFGKKNA